MKIRKSEPRTLKQLEKDYVIEKELASQLRNASREERQYLYTRLYDELFRLVPYLAQSASHTEKAKIISLQMNVLRRFLSLESTLLEVGPGDCKLAFTAASCVKKVYAVDVSNEITANTVKPDNFQLIISDGCSIPIPNNSVDVAFSNQLMEHLHPDDAFEQLQNIYNVLKPGGVYVCITPNMLSGPHDISRYFDLVATGFHLKEYTINELVALLQVVGFRKIQMIIAAREFVFPLLLPVFPFKWLEAVLSFLPRSASQIVANLLPLRILLDIKIAATK